MYAIPGTRIIAKTLFLLYFFIIFYHPPFSVRFYIVSRRGRVKYDFAGEIAGGRGAEEGRRVSGRRRRRRRVPEINWP